MTKKENNPEREKGAAPPDYMPAIFGWMSMNEQAEHAKEIADFSSNLKNKGEDKNDN